MEDKKKSVWITSPFIKKTEELTLTLGLLNLLAECYVVCTPMEEYFSEIPRIHFGESCHAKRLIDKHITYEGNLCRLCSNWLGPFAVN